MHALPMPSAPYLLEPIDLSATPVDRLPSRLVDRYATTVRRMCPSPHVQMLNRDGP